MTSSTIRPRLDKRSSIWSYLRISSPFSHCANRNGDSIGGAFEVSEQLSQLQFSPPPILRSNWLLRQKDRFLIWRDTSRVLDRAKRASLIGHSHHHKKPSDPLPWNMERDTRTDNPPLGQHVLPPSNRSDPDPDCGQAEGSGGHGTCPS